MFISLLKGAIGLVSCGIQLNGDRESHCFLGCLTMILTHLLSITHLLSTLRTMAFVGYHQTYHHFAMVCAGSKYQNPPPPPGSPGIRWLEPHRSKMARGPGIRVPHENGVPRGAMDSVREVSAISHDEIIHQKPWVMLCLQCVISPGLLITKGLV